MGNYLTRIDDVLGARRTAARAYEVLGDGAPLALRRPSTAAEFLERVRAAAPRDVRDGAGMLAGAAAGAVLWSRHRVLGAIGGASLGRNLPALFRPAQRRDALFRPAQRRDALCNLGHTGAAIFGSRLLSGTPSLGFLLGWLAAGIAIHVGGLRG